MGNNNTSRKKLYSVWERMISRCYNPNNSKYKFYGGKGVVVCDEWKSNYKSFLDWSFENGWKEGLQLDKDIIGSGLLYSPKTCCLVSRKENQRARKHLLKVIYKGQEWLLVELCDKFNIKCNIVRQRMRRDGMTLEQALTIKNIGTGHNFINRKKQYKSCQQ